MAIDGLRKLQNALIEIGVSQASISISKPTLSLGNDDDKHLLDDAVLFTTLIRESEIVKVSSDLFSSGHYSLAVAEAFKVVDVFISKKICDPKASGTAMMEMVFSPTNPKLRWSTLETKSQEDEQKGYQRLFAGAMLGIRNPATHEFEWISDPDTALELIVFAQHLLKKAKKAELYKDT